MKRFLFSLFFIVRISIIYTQNFEVGLVNGMTYYEGELSPVLPEHLIAQMWPNFGLSFKINLFRWLSFDLGYNQLELYANGAYANYHNNVSIKNPIKEYLWEALFYPIRWYPFKSDLSLSPYIGGGTIFLFHEPYGKYKGRWIKLRPIGTEGQGLPGFADYYSNIAFAIPLRLGFKLQLNRKWTLIFDLRLRYPFTDYLDDIGFVRVNPVNIVEQKGEIAGFFAQSLQHNTIGTVPAYSRRGSKRMDYYHSFSLGLYFRIGKIGYIGEKYVEDCWRKK